jgi:hypothetical protein
VIRDADGKIDDTRTLQNLQARILVTNEAKYIESISDPDRKKEF